jgi:hypothetical protein
MKPSKHTPTGHWRGVRTHRVMASPHPDAPARAITLPMHWDERAAAAVAALVGGTFPVVLELAVASWTAPLADPLLAARLDMLLLARRAAPTVPVWRGEIATLFPHPDHCPSFVLNLAAFADPGLGFDLDGFTEAVTDTARALARLTPDAPRRIIALADLAGLLAALGLAYDSEAARDLASTVAARARDAATPHAHAVAARPGPAEALLGVETGGVAPAFSPLDDAGCLTRAARAWLAARNMTPEAALAGVLAGQTPFPPSTRAAHDAMREAVRPFLNALPPMPAPLEVEVPAQTGHGAPRRRELPARHAGFTQRAQIGGHRVFLRTGEYPDGTLGEIGLSVPREGAAYRGLLDAFATAVSVGLQHGVPLDEYVEAMLLTRGGPAGAVEGDPQVGRATTSPLDYAARTLAAHYLGRTTLPEAAHEGPPPAAPSLPLDLPAQPRLRLVK